MTQRDHLERHDHLDHLDHLAPQHDQTDQGDQDDQDDQDDQEDQDDQVEAGRQGHLGSHCDIKVVPPAAGTRADSESGHTAYTKFGQTREATTLKAAEFDIVAAMTEVVGFPPVRVLERRVGALDDAHALVWFVRERFDLEVDAVAAFARPQEIHADCGCVREIKFTKSTFRRGLRRTEQSRVKVETNQCDLHGGARGGPFEDWGSHLGVALFALPHDPKRPDQWEHRE